MENIGKYEFLVSSMMQNLMLLQKGVGVFGCYQKHKYFRQIYKGYWKTKKSSYSNNNNIWREIRRNATEIAELAQRNRMSKYITH